MMYDNEADRPEIRVSATHEHVLDDTHPTPEKLVADTVPAPVMTSPLELTSGFRPVVLFLGRSVQAVF
jgi:hypothetical protein